MLDIIKQSYIKGIPLFLVLAGIALIILVEIYSIIMGIGGMLTLGKEDVVNIFTFQGIFYGIGLGLILIISGFWFWFRRRRSAVKIK